MKSSMATAKEILLRALQEPVGLLLATSDPAKARQLMYRMRATDARLAILQIRSVPAQLAEEGANLAITRGRPRPPEAAEDEELDQ